MAKEQGEFYKKTKSIKMNWWSSREPLFRFLNTARNQFLSQSSRFDGMFANLGTGGDDFSGEILVKFGDNLSRPIAPQNSNELPGIEGNLKVDTFLICIAAEIEKMPLTREYYHAEVQSLITLSEQLKNAKAILSFKSLFDGSFELQSIQLIEKKD